MSRPISSIAQSLVVGLVFLGKALFTIEPAYAQPNSQSAGAPHATRLVAEFAVLEDDLLNALQQGNQSALNKLIDSDFEYVFADNLDQSSTSSDLLNKDARTRWSNFKINDLSVRTQGDGRLVGFYLQDANAKQKNMGWAVQDYWINQAGSWKLRYRFIAQKNDSTKLPPGYIRQAVIDKRY